MKKVRLHYVVNAIGRALVYGWAVLDEYSLRYDYNSRTITLYRDTETVDEIPFDEDLTLTECIENFNCDING